MRERIAIAGAGRVACALGRLLRERGVEAAAVASRTLERAESAAHFIGGDCTAVAYPELPRIADRLLIAVSDDALSAVATLLAPACTASTAALHTSGRYGAEVLSPLAARGASCASLHPLQTVATAEQGVRALPGAAYALDGCGKAREWALEIVEMLSGTALSIPPEGRVIYHASAVMASNYLAGMIDASVALMEMAGVERGLALQSLGPLARASLDNVLAFGPVDALTGPIERGDVRTIAAHLNALAAAPETVQSLYRAAGRHVLDVARRRTPDRDREEIEELLKHEGTSNG